MGNMSGHLGGDVCQLLSPNTIKSLKFSIENILKPEFGKKNKELPRTTTSNGSSSSSNNSHLNLNLNNNNVSSSTVQKCVQKNSRSFDIMSLTGKRKHSSDSECSTTSSFSTTSKESNQKSLCGDQGSPPKEKKAALDLSKPAPANGDDKSKMLWPAWVYCTRYSDRPSSGPRSRRMKKKEKKSDEKRPRTAFTAEQLARLKQEFQENRYLTERRRQDLARDLKLNESQIKIWFQNKRAKIKKANGARNPLALHLMAQGLYNHSTVPLDDEYDEDEEDSQQRNGPSSLASSSPDVSIAAS